MGVANNYSCHRQLYRLVPAIFTPVQQIHYLDYVSGIGNGIRHERPIRVAPEVIIIIINNL